MECYALYLSVTCRFQFSILGAIRRCKMPLIGYFKGQPNEYVLKYSSGQIVREGQGLAFFYLKYKTQIVVVPTSSTDANLVFNEVTSSFQTVTIQGQFTYRIHNPRRAAELLNYTMDPATHRHVSDDPDRLRSGSPTSSRWKPAARSSRESSRRC